MKTKLYPITIALSLVLVASAAYAATTDFVANGNITVSSVTNGGVVADLAIVSGSQTESWAYTDGVFTVVNSDSTNPFRIATSDATIRSIAITNSDGVVLACKNDPVLGDTYVEVPVASGTLTVKPSTTGCVTASSSTSSSTSGSRSGGGGGASAVVIPVAVADAGCTAGAAFSTTTGKPCGVSLEVGCTPSAAFSTTTGKPCGGTGAQTAAPSSLLAVTAKFLRALNIGSIGSDVLNLQKFLNASGFTVAASGPGSPGNETTTFGSRTRAALIKFQIAKSIIKNAAEAGAGTVGPKTRAAINALLGK